MGWSNPIVMASEQLRCENRLSIAGVSSDFQAFEDKVFDETRHKT